MRFIGRAILAVGLVVAAGIYVANVLRGGGAEYKLDETKQYLRSMEMYGGKANLIASDFRQWFDGLWHGRTLAFTVAVLAVVVSLAYRFLATPLPPAEDEGKSGPRRI